MNAFVLIFQDFLLLLPSITCVYFSRANFFSPRPFIYLAGKTPSSYAKYTGYFNVIMTLYGHWFHFSQDMGNIKPVTLYKLAQITFFAEYFVYMTLISLL